MDGKTTGLMTNTRGSTGQFARAISNAITVLSGVFTVTNSRVVMRKRKNHDMLDMRRVVNTVSTLFSKELGKLTIMVHIITY